MLLLPYKAKGTK